MIRRVVGALAGVIAASAFNAEAQTYPWLEVELELAVQFDHIFDADSGGEAHLSDLYADSEAHIILHITPDLSLQSAVVLEPVRELTEDRFFDDQGLYLEQLFLNYDGGWFTVYGGKFNPGFGVAWDRTPGVYGADFAEDYEITEQIGFGGTLDLYAREFGDHRLGAAVFFADTTFLRRSAFTRPRATDPDVERPSRLRKRDGGPGNTERLESYVVSLDGGNFTFLPQLTYHLSHMRREAGATEPKDEKGYAAGLQFSLELAEDVALVPIFEVAWFDDFGGQDQKALYLTYGAELNVGPWSFAASYTRRRLDEPDDGSGPLGGDVRDRLIQASVGYQFENGLGVGAGVKGERVEGVDSAFVGLLLTYHLDFNIGGGRHAHGHRHRH